MTGTTAELGLPTGQDTDDLEIYLTTNPGGLPQGLSILDALFNAATGHDHSAVHKGAPIPAAGIANGAITSAKLGGGLLTTAGAALGADVALNNTANFFDGPSVSLVAGTWLIAATLTVGDTGASASLIGKLWDGVTAVYSSTQVTTAAAGHTVSFSLVSIQTLGATTTVKASVRDLSAITGNIRSTTPGASQGLSASVLVAVRIG